MKLDQATKDFIWDAVNLYTEAYEDYLIADGWDDADEVSRILSNIQTFMDEA